MNEIYSLVLALVLFETSPAQTATGVLVNVDARAEVAAALYAASATQAAAERVADVTIRAQRNAIEDRKGATFTIAPLSSSRNR